MNLLKNRTLIGIIAIVLSLLISFVLAPLFNKSLSAKTEILRVTKEIKAGEEITKDKVESVKVGGFGLPNEVLKDKEVVIGKFATAQMFPGDYILPPKISKSPASENAYLSGLTGEKQAISVSLKTFAKGLSGKLISGDIVTIIAPDYEKSGETVIPPELRYVEVIAVTADSGYDKGEGQKETKKDDEKELPSTATLLVSPEQSKILARLEEEGKLHLSLVFRGKGEVAREFIKAQDEVLEALYPKSTESKTEEANTFSKDN